MKLMSELEYFVAWVLYYLGFTFGGLVVGGIAGGIMGAILSVAGVPLETIKLVGAGIGIAVGIPMSYLFYRLTVGLMVVKKIEERVAMATAPAVQAAAAPIQMPPPQPPSSEPPPIAPAD
jgi:hypothetical protein